MSSDGAIVRAYLAAPLAGDPPHLDSLLEYEMSLVHPKAGLPGYKVDRKYPCPPQGQIPVPLGWRQLGPWRIFLCSAPVLGPVAAHQVDHIAKRVGVENAALLAPEERKVVSTTNSWTKSYRLPLRVRLVPWVAWFVRAEGYDQRREIVQALRRVRAIGKKVADGYGKVARWEVEKDAPPAWWFAEHARGPVLMRPLPVGPWLPEGLQGARRDFGGVAPPYWHPARHDENVVPA